MRRFFTPSSFRTFFTTSVPSRTFFTSSIPPTQVQGLRSAPLRNALLHFRSQRSTVTRRLRFLRNKTDKATESQVTNAAKGAETPEAPLSFSQRMKKLSKEYGWTALAVYMALSVLDFPLCFLAVRSLGTERIGHYEHVVVQWFKSMLGFATEKEGGLKGGVAAEETAREEEIGWVGDIEEAEAANRGATASIWTELALAYAIHKSFIFIRVPATAAILPKVVKMLRKRGWEIGKRKPKP
ncbi:uncharacterized protein EI97DRAFT_452525 [Westerdykella ornata]|uniref:DUF1279 domain-containing protein n=1 Tax=Westerdykella ornata TaxID=318751 RepID=A0A6A6JA81_WESOR|nr:uncharacterized protein EI97DRAFT_452525 [Westerdykella ornata]KAF2273235.1 hypothetical protein EI97DRAFT_452525 [Westerdykella ornata]